MTRSIVITPNDKVELVQKIRFIENEGYVKYNSISIHKANVCKGINQVSSNSVKFIFKEDGTLEKAPRSKFSTMHQVCATCCEVLDDYCEF